MNRRGVALVAVIWLLALLAVLAGVALVEARSFVAAGVNRLAADAARWAATGCVAFARAQFDWSEPYHADSVAISERLWCTVESEPAGLTINANLASAETIHEYLGREELADALLDWRDVDDVPRPRGAERDWYRRSGRAGPRDGPVVSVEELGLIRGFERVDGSELRQMFTVAGDGRVSVPHASLDVLAATGLIPLEALTQRDPRAGTGGRPVPSLEALAARLPAAHRAVLERRWGEALRQLDFGTERRTVRITGRVHGSAIRYQLRGEAEVADGNAQFHALERE